MLIPNVLSGLEKGSAKPLCVGSIPTRASSFFLLFSESVKHTRTALIS